MNAREFFDLVSIMREKQKEYFRTRDNNTLSDCKAIEMQVDSEIFRVNRILALRETAKKTIDYINSD
jgi:hypothetical protein